MDVQSGLRLCCSQTTEQGFLLTWNKYCQYRRTVGINQILLGWLHLWMANFCYNYVILDIPFGKVRHISKIESSLRCTYGVQKATFC